MPINIIPINGNSPLIDYDELRLSFEHFLGNKCTEATMYVFNRFGAPVSSEGNIDLLFLIGLHDIKGNYTRFNHIANGEGFEYFKNVIVPVTIQTQLEQADIEVSGNFLNINDSEYDAVEDLNILKFGLLNFLATKCGMDRTKLFFEPVQLLLNKSNKGIFNNYLVNSSLKGEQLFTIIKSNPLKYFRSYSPWTKDPGYTVFKDTAAEINEAISKFSAVGYLTKQKIKRIESQLTRNSAMYNSIGNLPTSINGKAGTGKTSHLHHLLIRCLKNNKNVTFLTYNHLLTKDIAYQVKLAQIILYKKWEAEGKNTIHFACATVQTLMGFIFRLSRNLGVLHLMTEDRVKELADVLRNSMNFLVANLPSLFQQNADKIFTDKNNWSEAIESIQNTAWNVSIKQYGISFVRYLKKHAPGLTQNLPAFAEDFYTDKMNQLKEMSYKNVFLRDYPGCLKNTLDVIKNTETFYDEFNVQNRYELLEVIMKLNERTEDEELRNQMISLNLFKKRVSNVIKGRTTKGRILMVDEGQDCHPFEREIFYEIFGPSNVVVSHGGKEQLVRYSEICNWDIFRAKNIVIKNIGSGNKSYRIKQSILDFCNFIASRHKIDLNLESFSPVDTGHIIFDFRSSNNIPFKNIFSELLERGNVNGCCPLEALMILDVNQRNNRTGLGAAPFVGVVNEYNVLEDEILPEYEDFRYLEDLGSNAEYWVGAVANKKELNFPAPNEVRILNYESCRGLEAWCVICFNIDSFYFSQKSSSDAEKYLLHEGAILTSAARAAMYAITWVLMAATRAIDTLYLQMANPENELYKLCAEYAKANPGKCTIYKN